MWQSSSQRQRALAHARKRERDRNRFPLHIQRIQVEISPYAQDASFPKTEVRMILNDLSNKGAGFFSSQSMTPGQKVTLVSTDPFNITLKGKVIYCQEYNPNSHILSEKKFSYRLGIEFIFETVEEKASLKDFVEEVSKNYITQK